MITSIMCLILALSGWFVIRIDNNLYEGIGLLVVVVVTMIITIMQESCNND